jgi:hypothetical protein
VKLSLGWFRHLDVLLFPRRELVVIFFWAVGLRICLLIGSVEQIGADKFLSASPDTVRYVCMATGLIKGEIADEGAFVIFGPGYALFLALVFLLFGVHAVPVILIQTVLSGIACIVIYKLSMILTDSHITSLIAAFLSVISLTSIFLSCQVLSDSLYFFLFLSGLVLYLKGLLEGSWRYYIVAGILTGFAVLCRSVGQFWPLVMIIIAFVFHSTAGDDALHKPRLTFKRRMTRSLVTIGVVYLIVFSWVMRNYLVHGVPMLAFTSAGGPANVAALTLERLENRKPDEIRADWINQYKTENRIEEFTYKDSYRMNLQCSWRVFRTYPWESFKTYFALAWTNLNEISHFHRVSLPKFNPITIPWERKIKSNKWNYLNFYLSMMGLALLLLSRRWRAFGILALIYFYYASMIGFTRWQGSRLFFPGQVAWAILIAVALVYPLEALDKIVRVREKVFPVLKSTIVRLIRGAKSFLSYDPETSRFYFFYYAMAILIGVVILFRRFIFSDQMLYGFDTMQVGAFFRSFLVNSVKAQGKIPMWNPYIFAGVPYVDAFHGDIFYPFSILKYFGDLFRMLGYNLIIHIYFAGIFMYLTAREMGLSKVASTLSGVSYMFAGYLVSMVAPGHDEKIYAASLFPLTILFVHRGFRNNRLLNFTLLGLVIGCVLLTHPQMSYYTLGCVVLFGLYKLYHFYRTGASFSSMVKVGALVGYALGLGLAISAIQIYPGYIYGTKYSPRVESLRGYRWAIGFSLHEEELCALVVPEFCGAESKVDPTLQYWGRNRSKDNSEYVGTIPLVLAVLGIFFYRRKGSIFWGAVSLAVLLYALGATTPLFRIFLQVIPLLGYFRAPSMSMFIVSFSMSLLAGMFVQSVMERRIGCSDKPSPWILRVLWGIPLLLFALGILYRQAPEVILRLYARLFYSSLLSGDPAANAKLEKAVAYSPEIMTGFFYAALFTGAAALIVWLFLTKKRSRQVLLVLPLLVMINGIRFNDRFISVIDQKAEFAPHPLVQFLKNRTDYGRAFGFALNERAFHIYLHGIASTSGYPDIAPRWYRDLLYHGRFIDNFFNYRFVNLLGARYVIYPLRGVLPPDTLGPIPMDTAGIFGQYVVFENKNAFPRAYLVNKYRVVPDRKKIYPLVLQGDADLRRIVYLEEEPELQIDTLADDSSYAEVKYYCSDSIFIAVNCSTNQLMILTDNYYPAWHAYVDGIERKIYRAYGSFRVVEIPAGSNQVVFRYHSTIYQRGKLLTFFGLIIALGVLAYYFQGWIRPVVLKIFSRVFSHKLKNSSFLRKDTNSFYR